MQDWASIVSAGSTAVYAVVSALSLMLLGRQVRDARRFGAAPAFYALLKVMEEHMVAVDRADATEETVHRALEFFERIEHLRGARLLPADVLRRAFGRALNGLLADPRFDRAIAQDPGQYSEVLALARRLA